MKPLTLRIAGLRSYREPVTIDFGWLGERGLFGIVGPTGAGKSTVLDALFLALYGRTPRSSDSVREVVPADVERASVELVFATQRAGETARWRVRREWKRSRDRATKALKPEITHSRCELHRIQGETETLVVDGAAVNKHIAESVVGIPFDDFTRAIVLPQGAFDQLLKAKPSERNGLFGRVFGLLRLGQPLFDKVAERLGVLKEEERTLEAQAGAVNVPPEELEAAREAEKQAAERAIQARAEAKVAEDRARRAEEGDRIAQQRDEANRSAESLAAEQQDIDRGRSELEAAERAARVWPAVERRESAARRLNQAVAEHRTKAQEAERLGADESKLAELATAAQERRAREEPVAEEALRLADRAIEDARNAVGHEQQAAAARAAKDAADRRIATATDKLGRLADARRAAQEDIAGFEKKLEQTRVSPEERAQAGRRLEAARALAEAASKVEDARKAAEEKKRAHEARAKAANADAALLAKLEATQKAAAADPALRIDLEALQHEGLQAKERHSRLKELSTRLDVVEKELENARKHAAEAAVREEKSAQNLARADAAATAALEACNQAERRACDAEEAVLAAMLREHAAALAEHLEDGAPCPVCGSVEHPAPARERADVDAAKAARKAARTAADLARAKLEEARKAAEVARGESRTAAEAAQLRRAAVEDLARKHREQAHEAGALGLDDWTCAEARAAAVAQAAQLHAELQQKWKADNAALNAAKAALSKADQELAGAVAKAAASRTEAAAAAQEAKQAAESFADARAAAEAAAPALLAASEGRDVAKAKSEWDALAQRDKRTLEVESALKTRREAVEKMDAETAALQQGLVDARADAAARAQEAERDSGAAARLRQAVADITRGVEPAAHRRACEAALARLRHDVESARGAAEQARQQAAAARAALAEVEKARTAAEQEAKEAEAAQAQGLAGAGFDSLDAARAAFRAEPVRAALAARLRAFEEKQAKANAALDAVAAAIARYGASLPTAQELAAARAQAAAAARTRDEALGEEATAREIRKAKEEAVAKGAAVRAQLAALQPQLARLQTLATLVQGQKLVEFAADRYLQRILGTATEHLRRLSSDRYALVRGSDGAFAVVDHHQAAMQRPTSTLSGGEGFLASLALALALSDHIQRQGSVRFDFFFLDEGFGALDEDTLETALDALERLRGQQRVIGMISHVPAMHERLPRRLVVSRAAPGGSARVRVEEA